MKKILPLLLLCALSCNEEKRKDKIETDVDSTQKVHDSLVTAHDCLLKVKADWEVRLSKQADNLANQTRMKDIAIGYANKYALTSEEKYYRLFVLYKDSCKYCEYLNDANYDSTKAKFISTYKR